MRLMVDWLTGHIAPSPDLFGVQLYEDLQRRFDTGKVLRVGPGGELQWQKAAHMEVRGSYDNSMVVRSPDGFRLELSGNPVKFLQGHNLFGSDDALGLYFSAGGVVRGAYGAFPSPESYKSLHMYGPRFSRIDLTRSYRFDSQDQAREWLRYVASTARTRHGSASMHKGGTVYFGKGSRRWSFKMYSKADEISARGKAHKVKLFRRGKEKILEEWADGVVRFELQLRGMELKKWPDISPQNLPNIWQHYYDSITWNRNTTAAEEGLDMIDKSQADNATKGYLARWLNGDDLRRDMAKPTFYKWRRRILDNYGIDIAERPQTRAEAKPALEALNLDPAGWDPAPIDKQMYRPDPTLPLKYQ